MSDGKKYTIDKKWESADGAWLVQGRLIRFINLGASINSDHITRVIQNKAGSTLTVNLSGDLEITLQNIDYREFLMAFHIAQGDAKELIERHAPSFGEQG